MEKEIPESQSPFASEPIGRLIVKFAVPSVIALLVNSLYNIVDQIFIGWGVGYLGNGATNIVFPITIIALALSMMIGNGGASYLSLKLGEGKTSLAQKGVGNAVTLVTVVSIILAVVFIVFINPILTLFGATDVLRPFALDYGYIIGIGLPFMMISASINSMIRADGSPKYAMFSMIIGAVLNVILDPVLIFIFDMGVKGAAIATVIGQVASFIVSVVYIPNLSRKPIFFSLCPPANGIQKRTVKDSPSISNIYFFSSLGSMRLSSMAITVAITTGDFPKIMINSSGNCTSDDDAWEIPTPKAALKPTMVVFLASSFWEAISFIPVMAMVENTVIVAPPSTH